MARRHLRSVLWRRQDGASLDYCSLFQTEEGFDLEGTVLTTFEVKPHQVHYSVSCDSRWRTLRVKAEVEGAGEARKLELKVDIDQRWWRGNETVTEVQGCTDVDLGVTPTTNTLPIRRLQLAEGQRVDLAAAWVRFPELTVEPLEQSYTRLSEKTYLYESRGGRYSSELEVDRFGLVKTYAGGWTRIAFT